MLLLLKFNSIIESVLNEIFLIELLLKSIYFNGMSDIKEISEIEHELKIIVDKPEQSFKK